MADSFCKRNKILVRKTDRFRFFLQVLSLLIFCSLLFYSCAREKAPPELPIPTPAAPKTELLKDWSQAVVYFVIVDRFVDGDPANNVKVDRDAKGAFHGGDLKGLIENLHEISDLGVTAIWITPVVKNIDGFVTGAGFPDWAYHGYWADDFTRLDPRFGTEEQLKEFVGKCHEKGISVLLDVVYNHAGYDSQYLKDPKTKTWFRSEQRGTCGADDVTSCVAGLPDFKTELPEVADYLYSANLGLAERVGLDGFRLDTVKHVSHEFWQEHRKRTRTLFGEDFFLLGEVWGGDPQVLDPWFAGDEMDAGFDFSFQGSVISFLQGRGRAVAFDRYLKSREKVRTGYFISHFLSSHDVPTGLFLLKEDKELFRLAAVLQFTAAGIPMIYYGEEVGRVGGDWPENRSDMPWGDRKILPGAGDPRDEDLREFYKKLISIRRKHPALTSGVHTNLIAEGDLVGFSRLDATSGDAVVVLVNRGNESATASFLPPAAWNGGPAEDLLSGTLIELSTGSVETIIPPRSAQIFVSNSRE